MQRFPLADALETAIPKLRVLYGSIVDVSGSDLRERVIAALPPTAKARKAAGLSFLTEDEIVRFFLDEIEDLLPGVLSGLPVNVPITAVERLADHQAITRSLVEIFVTLPWQYTMMFPTPIPASTAKQKRQFDLGGGFSIEAFGAEAAGALPLPRSEAVMNGLMQRRVPEGIAVDHYYFVQTITGYITRHQSPALDTFVDAAKGFFGLSSML